MQRRVEFTRRRPIPDRTEIVRSAVMGTPAATPNDPPQVSTDPFEGTPYRLQRPLARGGMGQVFLVEHRQLGRQFVAKILHDTMAADPQLADRFRIEAQSLGRLRHPNIVSIFGFGTTSDKRPFIVTEYLEGRTLAQQLASCTALSIRDAIRYTRETLAALSAAHDVGIVHRDVKPENLFMHEQPYGPTCIKVLDFGLARVIPGASALAPQPLAVPTKTGVVFGTPHYISPEAALGEHVDQRADLYSVGLVLYKMLAGQGPFDHLSGPVAVMTAHLTDPPAAPSALSKQAIPAALDAIVLKALEKDPASRFQSAQEFSDALAEVQASCTDSKHPPAATVTANSAPDASLHAGRVQSTDTNFTVPVSGGKATRFSRMALLTLGGIALLTAGLVYVVGHLFLVTQGGP